MAKFKYKKQLKNPIQKLYDGFIRANFFLNHIQEIRNKYRKAFLAYFTNQNINENLKIIDSKNNLISHLSWHQRNPEDIKRHKKWYPDENPQGEYHQVQTYPYNCVTKQTIVKKNSELLKTPIKIYKNIQEESRK